jgi:hypothetical protein
VFVAADLDLASTLRACGFKAACFFRDAPHLTDFVSRRRVLVVHRDRQSLAQAHFIQASLAGSAHPAELGRIELAADLRIPGEFATWWADALEGDYHSGTELEHRAWELAQKVAPAPDGEDEGEAWPELCFREEPESLSFPVEVFPLPLQRYCRGVASVTLAPTDLVGASMLATASAAIGQAINLTVKRTWREAPLLYLLIVAEPGKTKSPIIKLVVKPLTKIDMRLRKEATEARQHWEEAKKAYGKDPNSAFPPGPEPPQRRAIVKDVTRESLVTILRDNPRGVLADPDEATGWVGSFNEYKGKGSDRQFWLDIWGSRPISVDREGGKRSSWVGSPMVTVLGGLPPAMLGSLAEEQGRDDGFLDRILFVFPRDFPRQVWTEEELDEGEESTWFHVIDRLHIQMMCEENNELKPHYVGFSAEAKHAWVEFFNRHCAEMESDDLLPVCVGFWSKLRAYAARLALILSRLCIALDPEADDLLTRPISLSDMQGAIALVEYFKTQVLRVHHRMTAGIGSRDARTILEWIGRRGVSEFRERDVRQDLRRRFPDPESLQGPLRILIQAGAIRPKLEPLDSSRRGRKPTPAYEVNPVLKDAPQITQNTQKYPPERPIPEF